MKSKRYPNLFKHDGRPHWAFRKYSKEKKRQFYFATGEAHDEALAYRKGLEAFNAWLGSKNRGNGPVLFREIALDVLASKEGGKYNTYRTSKNQIKNHLIPAFGHLRIEQVNRLRWEKWISDERRRNGGIKKFFNAHKSLMEILRRAQEESLIDRLPELQNPDGETESGQWLDDLTVQRMIKAASQPTSKQKEWKFKREVSIEDLRSPHTALLIEIMWRMGPRPSELCQWEFTMIDWAAGPHGFISIPGRITKTGRSRTIPLNSKVSALLRVRMEGSSSRFVFPSPVHRDRPIKEYKTGFETACREAGVEAIPYDLRHTFITNQARKGRPILDVARYCDTSPKMIEKIYAKSLKASMEEIAG